MDKIWLKSYQKNTPTEIDPSTYASLNELLTEACQKFGDNRAFLSMGSCLSFKELDNYSRYLATYLQQLNLAKSARVAIILPNILQYPISLLAILRAGLVVVNTNPLYTPSELIHQLGNAQAEVAIVFEPCSYNLQQALPELPNLKHVIVTKIGDMFAWPKRWFLNTVLLFKHPKISYKLPNAISFSQALHEGRCKSFKAVICCPEDPAFLQYTGGTTGVNKAAVLSHRNMVANVLQTSAWISSEPMNNSDLIITALPLYHVFSLLANCLLFWSLGVRNLLIADPRSTKAFLKQIHKYPPTAITGVNTLYAAILNHPNFNAEDFAKLKIALSGGMALNHSVAERWQAVVPRPIIEAYGLSEASPAVCINPLNNPRQGSIGLPLPSTEISIRDEQGDECSVGDIGELCVRGPQVMQKYWENSQETHHVFHADGFLKTGDSVRMDNDGFLYLSDRIKDLIIVSGFNVYPHEVEDVIARMDKVLEVAVIGVPSKGGNERIKACVVARDASLSSEEVIDYCRKYLTSYKMPKIVEFYSELPKTNVGKILKRMLR